MIYIYGARESSVFVCLLFVVLFCFVFWTMDADIRMGVPRNTGVDHNNGPQGIHNDKRNIMRRGSLKHQREFKR